MNKNYFLQFWKIYLVFGSFILYLRLSSLFNHLNNRQPLPGNSEKRAIMGEYVKIKGESVKLGTCEDLYYTTHGQLCEKVFEMQQDGEANLNPWDYLDAKNGFRYRFPFPDEDGQDIGSYSDFDRGALFRINRAELPEDWQQPDAWEDVNTWVDNRYHSQLRFYTKVPNPNNKAEKICFEVVQQKSCNGLLVTVFRDPYTGNKWREENPDKISAIAAAILKEYEGHKFSEELVKRMLDGYRGTVPAKVTA